MGLLFIWGTHNGEKFRESFLCYPDEIGFYLQNYDHIDNYDFERDWR